MEILLTNLKKCASFVLMLAFLAELAGGLLLFPRTAEAAIAVDASTPVRFSGSPAEGVPITSASFTAPANSVLIACVHGDDLDAPLTFTVADSGSLQWKLRASRGFGEAGAVDGHVSVYTAVTTSAVARTVSVTRVEDSLGTDEISAKVYVVTGASTASPVATVGEGSSGSNNITPTLFNTSPNGSYAFVCGTDWNSNGVPVSSDLTVDGNDQTGISSLAGYKALTGASSQTANLDAAGAAAASWNWVALAVTPRSNLSKPPNNLGLIGYWPMNEATSTIAGDFSGRGNHGALALFSSPPTASSGWTSKGARGGALLFDAVDDSFSIGDLNNLTDGVQNLTISVWIKENTLGDFNPIVIKASGIDGWAFETGAGATGGSDDFIFYPSFSNANAVYSTSNSHQAGVWEHWVLTFDGTIVNDLDSVDFYKNGVEITSEAQTAAIPNITDSNATGITVADPFFAGAGGGFNGAIDELRIYNRTLTASEVASLYGSGASRLFASSKTLTNGTTLGPANGLVGLWSFDGADFITAVIDGSGNGRNGYVQGAATSTMKTLGKLGQAANFNESGSIITVPDNAGLNFGSAQDFSVAFWAKPLPIGGVYAGMVGDKLSRATNRLGYLVAYESDGVSVYISDGTDEATVFSSGTINDGAWHHIILTASRSGNANLYIDGTVTGTPASMVAVNSIDEPSSPVIIGDIGFGGQPYDGALDDVRIYNKVLSASEIRQLYQLGAVKVRP